MASAISTEGDLIYMVRNKPFDSKAITEFLELLLQELKKILIIWDNASIHNSKLTKDWLKQLPNKERIFLVQQPKYSPELNADEQVWNFLKTVELKNTCNQNVKELNPRIITAMEKMKSKPQLIKSFFQHPDLGFYN